MSIVRFGFRGRTATNNQPLAFLVYLLDEELPWKNRNIK